MTNNQYFCLTPQPLFEPEPQGRRHTFLPLFLCALLLCEARAVPLPLSLPLSGKIHKTLDLGPPRAYHIPTAPGCFGRLSTLMASFCTVRDVPKGFACPKSSLV